MATALILKWWNAIRGFVISNRESFKRWWKFLHENSYVRDSGAHLPTDYCVHHHNSFGTKSYCCFVRAFVSSGSMFKYTARNMPSKATIYVFLLSTHTNILTK